MSTEERTKKACELLARVVKYAREDRARTPRSTRLARVLVEAERFLSDESASGEVEAESAGRVK